MSTDQDINAVLFDLDGTLADTSPDLTAALNELLKRYNKDPLDYEKVRPHTSRGGMALVELGFEYALDENEKLTLRDEFLEIYAEILCVETKLFPGVLEVLDAIEFADIPWGIVTNKPESLTTPLVQELNIAMRAVCVVSGDSLDRRKPHPDQLIHAANKLGVPESECIYMGDDPRDIEAGKAAGMKTAVASYGYIMNGENPSNWGADAIFSHALDLKDWLFKSN